MSSDATRGLVDHLLKNLIIYVLQAHLLYNLLIFNSYFTFMKFFLKYALLNRIKNSTV